ncbi:MAG TPA: A/G-specific adenine glycosylase [Candidatus Dormibacteraeota bacterium]|nr:A/G-specific adenine glycosylase [Candidatus Dormibacteraeota bacterium]
MMSGGELARFRKRLLAWYRQFRRDLPWRGTRDPYRIWLSEIMLQQTRVAAVIPYYEKFLQRFPDVRTLAEAPQEEVLRLWSGLGYYSRARNLQRAAQQIVARKEGERGSEFPRKLDEALALPGIGAYTAAAILSIAYGEKLAVLDGNVARVLARLGAMRGDLRAPGRWQSLQQMADSVLDSGSPGDWNQAMMELGATLCTPRLPQCLLCPVASFCEGRKLGIAEMLPEKRKKREPVAVMLAAAVFVDSKGRTLLLAPPKKEEGSNWAGAADHVPTLVSKLWHFPTISVRENPVEELLRSLRELFGGNNRRLELQPLGKVRHAVTYRNITIVPFLIVLAKLPRIASATILPLDGLASLPISNLTRKVAASALPGAASERRPLPRGDGGKLKAEGKAAARAVAGYR